MIPEQEKYTISIMCSECKHIMYTSTVLSYLTGQALDFALNILIPFLIEFYASQEIEIQNTNHKTIRLRSSLKN